jgi:hypothetical protein
MVGLYFRAREYMTKPRQCALPECKESLVGYPARAAYCSETHSNRAKMRRARARSYAEREAVLNPPPVPPPVDPREAAAAWRPGDPAPPGWTYWPIEGHLLPSPPERAAVRDDLLVPRGGSSSAASTSNGLGRRTDAALDAYHAPLADGVIV